MTYAWTDEMKNISKDSKLEQMTREAVIAACMFCDELAAGDLPRFDGDQFLRPGNATATKMAAFAMANAKTSNSVESSVMLTTAVMVASVFMSNGKGQAGWAGVQKFLAKPQAKKPAKPVA